VAWQAIALIAIAADNSITINLFISLPLFI